MIKPRKSILALAAAAVIFSAIAAQADTITFDLTSDHCTGGCLTNQTSGGTISVTDSGGADTLTFTVSLLNGNQLINTGFDATFGFNLAGDPTVTYSGVPTNWIVEGPSSPNLTEGAGSLHMDGAGFFEYGLLWGTQGGSSGTSGPLTFTITGDGLTLASLEQNASGQFFAADILSGTTGLTGIVDASLTPVGVPDGGSTLTLLGSVLLGLGILRRKLSKN